MSTVTLTEADKVKLNSLVANTVDCPIEKKALDTARKQAIKLATIAHGIQFPAGELAILAGYALTHKVVELPLIVSNSGDDADPLWCIVDVPCDNLCHPICSDCNEVPDQQCLRTEKGSDLHRVAVDYQAAESNHKSALQRAADDYNKMIKSSIYFSDVVEVWPEANQLRDKMEGSHHNPNGDNEVIKRVRANVKARLEAANNGC